MTPAIDKVDLGWLRYPLMVLLVGGVVHQFLIYESVIEMEESPGTWVTETGGWYAKPAEKVLRFIIFALLIVSAGKLHDFLRLVFEIDSSSDVRIVLAGIVTMFSFLVVWNIIAIAYAMGSGQWQKDKTLGLFLASDGFALAVGICVNNAWGDEKKLGWVIGIMLLLLVYCLLICYRINRYFKRGRQVTA